MRTIASLGLACWLLLPALASADEFGGKIVVGYAVANRPQVFTDPAMRDFTFDRVTHVVLMGGVTFDKDGVVTVDDKLVAEPVAVTHAKHRKISAIFMGPHAAVCASPAARETLIAGVIAACTKHGFDGADFDYEYPETMQQRADFETFLTDLRAAAPALDWVFLMGYGPATIEKKTRHAVEKGAAGVGWWYIGLDCQDQRSVMEAAVQALRSPAAQP